MTTTDTTTSSLELERDTLTLVLISPEYFRTGDQNHLMPNGDDDSRTYYATVTRDGLGEAWATILDPVDRGRLSGWAANPQYGDLLGEGAEPHNGWNLRRTYLSPVVTLEEALATVPVAGERLRAGSPVTVGERLEYADERGAGDSMCPAVAGDRATVEWADADGLVRVTFDDGHASTRDRSRFRRVVEETPQEATSAPLAGEDTTPGLFTREALDEAVAEAVARERREGAEALERFKEHANGIAVQYAKDNDLCGNFERAMSDIGLLGREEWDEAHTVTRYVTFRVEVEVAPDADNYTARHAAAEFLSERYVSSIIDYAVEVQDDDGETLWSD